MLLSFGVASTLSRKYREQRRVSVDIDRMLPLTLDSNGEGHACSPFQLVKCTAFVLMRKHMNAAPDSATGKSQAQSPSTDTA